MEEIQCGTKKHLVNPNERKNRGKENRGDKKKIRITLNVNGLNMLFKRQSLRLDKKARPKPMLFKRYTLKIQRHKQVKVKEIENLCYVNTKHKKLDAAISILHKEHYQR